MLSTRTREDDMRTILISTALVLSLAACTQNADGTTSAGVPGSPMWHATTSQENKIAYYQAQCAGYGYAMGTPQMAQCVQIEAVQSRSTASAQVQNVSRNMQQQAVMAQNNNISCTSQRIGNTVSTNCY